MLPPTESRHRESSLSTFRAPGQSVTNTVDGPGPFGSHACHLDISRIVGLWCCPRGAVSAAVTGGTITGDQPHSTHGPRGLYGRARDSSTEGRAVPWEQPDHRP